nr:helix-turn-helix domain-containing protein [uncultured Dysosmobacter sp.]
MARTYNRLTYENRKTIEKMCKAGKKVTEIANAVGVHRATIYNELIRGGATSEDLQQYSADTAQKAV